MPEPKSASEYLDRGCDKDDKKDSKGAIEDYTKAIALNPNYSEAYVNRGATKEELGDLMFTLVNVARWFQLSPEEGLAGTNRRFLNRFSYIESNLEGSFSEYSLNELKILWEEAKLKSNEKNTCHLKSIDTE